MNFYMVYQNHASHGLNATCVNAGSIEGAIIASGFNREWVVGVLDMSHEKEIADDIKNVRGSDDDDE